MNKPQSITAIIEQLRTGATRAQIWQNLAKNGVHKDTFNKHFIEAKKQYQAEIEQQQQAVRDRDMQAALNLPTKMQVLSYYAKILDTANPTVTGYELVRTGEQWVKVACYQSEKLYADALKALLAYHNEAANGVQQVHFTLELEPPPDFARLKDDENELTAD